MGAPPPSPLFPAPPRARGAHTRHRFDTRKLTSNETWPRLSTATGSTFTAAAAVDVDDNPSSSPSSPRPPSPPPPSPPPPPPWPLPSLNSPPLPLPLPLLLLLPKPRPKNAEMLAPLWRSPLMIAFGFSGVVPLSPPPPPPPPLRLLLLPLRLFPEDGGKVNPVWVALNFTAPCRWSRGGAAA